MCIYDIIYKINKFKIDRMNKIAFKFRARKINANSDVQYEGGSR